MNPVLIVIDMEKDFFKKEGLKNQSGKLIKNINDLISKFRSKKIPIIWIRQTMKADLSDAPLGSKKSGNAYVVENTQGSEFLDGLDFQKKDIVVIKKRYSGFFQTNLEEILKKLNVDLLIICGINTHACVRMTVIDAYMRDYEIVVAKDCVGSYDQEHHNVSMKYFTPTIAQVKSNEEILQILNN